MAQMLELIPSSRKKKNGEIAYKGVLNHIIYVDERRSADRITWVCEEKRKYTEQRFLQFNTNEAEYDEDGKRVYDEPRIVMFGTANGLKILHESQDWFCNGTFDMTSKGFSQYYTIHCQINKGELGVYTLPCLFILMPNRQTCTYI
uniref:Uncharacterized protein n=1 Tax=Plectus sambesii TaxID=2011161 RepID=A0A914VSK3_9BILA